MNPPAVIFIVLLVAGVILVGNIMIAVAWFRDPQNKGRGATSRDEKSMDELHRRIEELRDKKD